MWSFFSIGLFLSFSLFLSLSHSLMLSLSCHHHQLLYFIRDIEIYFYFTINFPLAIEKGKKKKMLRKCEQIFGLSRFSNVSFAASSISLVNTLPQLFHCIVTIELFSCIATIVLVNAMNDCYMHIVAAIFFLLLLVLLLFSVLPSIWASILTSRKIKFTACIECPGYEFHVHT